MVNQKIAASLVTALFLVGISTFTYADTPTPPAGTEAPEAAKAPEAVEAPEASEAPEVPEVPEAHGIADVAEAPEVHSPEAH